MPHQLTKMRFIDIANMFHIGRSSRPKLFCKNFVFKRFTQFTIKNKSTVSDSRFQKAARSRVISERLLRRYFVLTPILKNLCEWLLTVWKKTTHPKEIRKDNMKYLSALVLLYQRIFVFYSSLTFPGDLYWPIKFQILSNQSINYPHIYAPKHWTSQLESYADKAVIGTCCEAEFVSKWRK